MAMAASVALAGNTTYNALSWKVGAKDLTDNGAVYARLYATVGEARIGGAAGGTEASVPANGDLDLEVESSVVQGEGGWDWGTVLPENATFFVELLNASRQKIVTSKGVAYADLLSAGALDVNYEGSHTPVNASGVQAFADFAVADHGEFKFLRETFGDAATVVPVLDADGNVISYTVKLKADMTGPVTLADNLGKVTLNLNRHAIEGTNGVNGVAGGNAIEIAGNIEPVENTNPTELTLVSENIEGYKGKVAGGNGGAGANGGNAVYVASASQGQVKVNGSETAVVTGGNGGDGMTAGQGGAAFAKAESVNAVSDISGTGSSGTAYVRWAYCTCTFSGDLPDGVSQDGTTLNFWNRNAGGAAFNFEVLAGQEIQDRTIHFVDGDIYVDQLKVPASAGDLVFAGGTDTRILAHPFGSAFEVVSSEGQARAWTNLTFTCEEGITAFITDNGGAINAVSGRVDIVDCTFTGCGAGQLGGAVFAAFLSETSSVVRTRFEGNGNEAGNFQGGAIYATASKDDVSLVIDACSFVGNTADFGGAISTETAYDAAEKPIALDIADSRFEDNVATDAGGAIYGEGDILVDAEATWDNPGTTVFANNFASYEGGAIRLDSYADEPQPVTVGLGRGVRFIENVVSNDTTSAQGGAIDIEIEGSVFAAEGVEFRGNAAYGSGASWDAGVAGGALCNNLVDLESFTVDTCVFASNAVVAVVENYIYGAAVEIVGDGAVLLKNSTFRNQNYEAVAISGAATAPAVAVTNCVAVGNGTHFDEPLDLYFVNVKVDMAYTAYGAVDVASAASVVETNDLSDRKETIYEDETSLRLSPIGFNPVAALGLPQAGVYDFAGVEYGSKEIGYSMGAYETPTEPVVVNLDGTRFYDGTMESNGCAWAWTLWATNGQPLTVAATFADLNPAGGLESLFTIDSWTFGNDDAGYYASSNAAPANITAEFSGANDEIQRWIDLEVIAFAETGTIKRRPVEMGGITFEFDPEEYEYTGAPVNANVVLRDTLAGEDLVTPADYTALFTDNVNPTDAANAIITFNRNFEGETNSTYFITAYLVEYTYDGKLDTSLTEVIGKLSGNDVAADDAQIAANLRAGYAFDVYDPASTGTVRRLDAEDGILRLQVRYLTDSNGVDVPDVYQRKITAKVVNGEWNDAAKAGVNQDVWVTLWKDGKWSASGTGAFGGVKSGTLPEAGAAPDSNSQANGGWLKFDGSKFVVVQAGDVITASTLPIYLYGYLAQGSTSGHTARGRGTATQITIEDLAKQYGVALSIGDFSVGGDSVTLIPNLSLTKDGAPVEGIPAAGTLMKVKCSATLGGEATEVEATVNGDGTLNVAKPEGPSAFLSIGL